MAYYLTFSFLFIISNINCTAETSRQLKPVHPREQYLTPLLKRQCIDCYTLPVFNPLVEQRNIRYKKGRRLKRKANPQAREQQQTNTTRTLYESIKDNGTSLMITANYTVIGNRSNVAVVSNPLTLPEFFTKLELLIYLVACSVVGIVLNGYFVTAFCVENTLRRIGHVFLACLGLTDIFATLVFPITAYMLLSDGDGVKACKSIQALITATTYSYSIFCLFTALDAYLLHCHSKRIYKIFTSMRIDLIPVIVYVTSAIFALIGVYLSYDYDYCEMSHYGNQTFRIATFVIFHVIPFILTVTGISLAIKQIFRKARMQGNYRRSQRYERDKSLTGLHLLTIFSYFLSWSPYLITRFWFPDTKSSTVYVMVNLAMLRCIISSLIYFVFNKCFRWAFGQIFNYCCCKISLSGHIRHRNFMEYRKPVKNLKTHILHNKAGIPQRATSASRETQEL